MSFVTTDLDIPSRVGDRLPTCMVESGRLEFKMHTAVSIEEVPIQQNRVNQEYKLKRSKQPLSKALNAMLNSGEGGVVLLGVSDEGLVKGLPFTVEQQDHFCVSVYGTLQRYEPKPVGLVSVAFIRLQSDHDAEENLAHETSNIIDAQRSTQHRLFTATDCWCSGTTIQRESRSHSAQDRIPLYVVKLTVHRPPRDEYGLKTVYQNEEGLCYIRRSSSNMLFTLQMVYEQTVNEMTALNHGKDKVNDTSV